MDFQQFYSPFYSLYRDRNFIGMIHDILDTIIIIISFIFFRWMIASKLKMQMAEKRGTEDRLSIFKFALCKFRDKRQTLYTPPHPRIYPYALLCMYCARFGLLICRHWNTPTLLRSLLLSYANNLTFISIIGGRRGIYISFSTRGTRVSGKRPAAWNLPPLITHSRLNIVEETGV